MSGPVPDPAELLTRLAALPPFPSSANRLLTISIESANAIDQYQNAFRTDPALASDLLRVANSVEFGLVASVENIRQALTLLGLERVHSLAISLAMLRYAGNVARVKVMQPIWAHAMASAVISEAMGAEREFSARGLYTAGLVHDVGRLGLLLTTEGRYAHLLAQPVSGPEEAAALERAQFGLTHSEAGAIMAQAWAFPGWLCDIIRRHHSEEEDRPTEERFRLAQLACRYASALGYPEHGDPHGPDPVWLELPADLRGRPALEPDRLRQRVANLLFTMGRPG